MLSKVQTIDKESERIKRISIHQFISELHKIRVEMVQNSMFFQINNFI